MKYFDNQSSAWVINFSVEDLAGEIGRNSSTGDSANTFTYNELSAISLPHIFINFSTVTPGQNDVRAGPRLILNNTGNADFDYLNMSAGALIGDDTGSSIAVTNFGINLTNSSGNKRATFPTNGHLDLRDTTTGLNASLIHGHTSALTDYGDIIISSKGNISVFFWINVPTGLTSQLYNASWNITVSDIFS